MHHDRLAGICCTCCARSETVIRVRVGFATTSSSSWLSWLFQGWHIHISTSTVFAYPGGNEAISDLFRATSEAPLSSYAYEPSKLSRSLPASAGAGFALPSRRIAAFVWPSSSCQSTGWLARWGLNSSPPPAVCTSPHHQRPVPDGCWRTAALLTTRASCRVKLLRGICMCLPR